MCSDLNLFETLHVKRERVKPFAVYSIVFQLSADGRVIAKGCVQGNTVGGKKHANRQILYSADLSDYVYTEELQWLEHLWDHEN